MLFHNQVRLQYKAKSKITVLYILVSMFPHVILPMLACILRISLISWRRRQVFERRQILKGFITYLYAVILFRSILRKHEHTLIFSEFTPKTTPVPATKIAERFPYSTYLCFRSVN